MIKLHPHRILLKNSSGQQEAIDLREIEIALDRALADCGIQESWLADHILFALQDYAAIMVTDGTERIDQKSLTPTLARMLVDAGYADVAARFAEQNQLEPAIAGAETQSPWSLARIEELLNDRLRTARNLSPGLGERVKSKLEALNFNRVGDSLIIELARHIIAEWNSSEREQATTAVNQDWLLTPGFWQTFLPPAVTDLVTHKILQISPISELLPVVRMRLCLPSLAERIPDRPLTDLRLMPVVGDTARQVAVAIKTLIRHLERKGEKKYLHPAHLSVLGLEQLLTTEFPETKKSRTERRGKEIVGLLTECLRGELDHRLILTFHSKPKS